MGLARFLQASRACVTIELQKNGIALAAGASGARELSALAYIDNDSFIGHEDKILADFVQSHNLNKASCTLVLPPEEYQLLLVEAPEVPKEELREALKWKIKDLLSMPVEDAAIDIFELPQDAAKSGKDMLYVVASKFSFLRPIIDKINEAQLVLKAIDISELAIRNISLIAEAEGNERAVAIARLSEGQGSLSIFKNGNLYLTRNFKINYGAGLLDDLPVDSLALEIQRSLDYFERQMGQAPPSSLFICGENISEDKITQDLARGLTVPAKYLDLESKITLKEDIDASLVQLSVGAIGAYLGNEVRV